MLNALVVAHYNFKNDKGKKINTTKLRVSLGEFGIIELCTDEANDCEILSSVKVKLSYDDVKNRFVINELVK